MQFLTLILQQGERLLPDEWDSARASNLHLFPSVSLNVCLLMPPPDPPPIHAPSLRTIMSSPSLTYASNGEEGQILKRGVSSLQWSHLLLLLLEVGMHECMNGTSRCLKAVQLQTMLGEARHFMVHGSTHFVAIKVESSSYKLCSRSLETLYSVALWM